MKPIITVICISASFNSFASEAKAEWMAEQCASYIYNNHVSETQEYKKKYSYLSNIKSTKYKVSWDDWRKAEQIVITMTRVNKTPWGEKTEEKVRMGCNFALSTWDIVESGEMIQIVDEELLIVN